MSYPGVIGETVSFEGHNGDKGEAYYARPTRAGKFPGVVLIHHMPGWDEWIVESTRKIAHHGFTTISPHLYFREGPGSPDDVGARVRAAGGVPDEQVVGDAKGAAAYLRAQLNSNGKVGVMGFCSGGRHAFLVACRAPEFEALVDCWGGNVVVDDPKALNAKRPVAPIDLAANIKCPIIGLFGNDDENPNADQVNRTEAVLKKLGKAYEFHRYDGAGHAFFNYARGPAYRAEQAADGWKKVSTSTSRPEQQHQESNMCSYIVEKARMSGSAKGPSGWMRIDTANVYYDHPYHAPLDHALGIDFICEADGGRERVAVELSRESALALIETIKAALASGDAWQARRVRTPGAGGVAKRNGELVLSQYFKLNH